MGSGAFLVAACRYLATELSEAWAEAAESSPGRVVVTPAGGISDGDPGETLLPADEDERLSLAMRYVAERCIYGVDKNPLAVEMAKLSLWLVTLQKDRPFTFLDHALRCGDSLLGVGSLEQIRRFDALGEDEELPAGEARPRERYLLGCLAPRKSVLDPAQHDGLGAEEGVGTEDGEADAETLAAPSIFPQSIGLTFAVDLDVRALKVRARWGRYHRGKSSTQRREDGEPKRVWRREAMEGWRIVELEAGEVEARAVCEDVPDVVVRGQVRRRPAGWIVTLFLVNGQMAPKRNEDAAWVFQPELSVRGAGVGAAFVRREPADVFGEDTDPVVRAEHEALAMIYRHRVEHAVGHGVGVRVEIAPGDPTRAVEVVTDVAPVWEVARVESAGPSDWPELGGLELDMRALSRMQAPELSRALAPLPGAYRSWIDKQRERAEQGRDGLGGHGAAAEAALGRCEQACARIEEGLGTLASNREAALAFRFTNEAMWRQRIQGLLAEHQRRERKETSFETLDRPENRSWRLFQLAFLLQSLPGVGVRHPDRAATEDATADLIWFPTGGGKTEAYLGLAAYAMALRRLEKDRWGRDGGKGVAVLMRYTLRLLTLQQFQRATALICACEVIRREAERDGSSRWGSEPFRIGLWVGMKTTPNSTEAADDAIKQLRGASEGFRQGLASPAQLTFCPWCGFELDGGKDYKVRPFKSDIGRTLAHCPSTRCPFNKGNARDEGLPIVVVDHELYRHVPTLIIATVDKLAQLPWNGATQTLFGQVAGYCTRHGFRTPTLQDSNSHPARNELPRARTVPAGPLRPPDLIIQDELHLISGPLGTLVGLYETAVDELCTWEVEGRPVRPKVVASTATIRRAKEQVHRVFLRRVAVFPPHGLDVEDNFFALERSPSEDDGRAFGRRYLGVCAPGRRLKAAMIRTYVALMAAAQKLHEEHGLAADPWMTVLGYFGSIRELAGMRRLCDDDVRSRLRRTDRRGLARRTLRVVDELTSRKQADDIPRMLDRLEVPFDPEVEAARKEAHRERHDFRRPRPFDAVLATNMVSVGVDVRRLGLMVTAGQPKTTAEYIQATSRVGRSAPGLVVTVYNWARPRDLSHYERFAHYHATFYQHVEALSVTPFSAGALERGLSALLVALVRDGRLVLNDNLGAGKLLSSANLTGRAMTSNMELGLLLRGGSIPGAVADHFEALITDGVLELTTG